jgi:hypothetical protein
MTVSELRLNGSASPTSNAEKIGFRDLSAIKFFQTFTKLEAQNGA